MLGKLKKTAKRKLSKTSIRRSSRTSSFKVDILPEPGTEPPLPMAGIEAAAALLTQELQRNEGDKWYYQKRRELLDEEDRLAWFESARLSASHTEVTASKIVVAIREQDRIDPTLFGNLPSEDVPDWRTTRDFGGRYLDNKATIDRSRLFKIAKRMPKGCHLHVHLNTEIAPEELLLIIDDHVPETMFIRTTRPLIEKGKGGDFDLAEVVFAVLPKDTLQGNVFSQTYDPDWKKPESRAWMRWMDFQAQFPADVQLEEADYPEDSPQVALLSLPQKYVRERMIITRNRAYESHQTHNGAWACFNQGTRAFKGLLGYESAYRWYIAHAVDRMIDDHIMYTEWRPMLLDKKLPRDNGVDQLGHKEQMQILCEIVSKKQKELESKNSLDKLPFGVRIIYCTPRSIPRARMASELKDCIDLKLAFPDLICGFDLVGAEDRPNSISVYADMLVGFTETCKMLGISIPFFFHAGETLLDTGGSADPTKSNLYDALLLNAKRIGHGYALTKHPLLVEKYKQQNICLELCPISNELLHLCGNIRQHPYPSLLGAGLHCTISADNASLFRNVLSHEFYQVMVGDTRMNVHGWKQLAMWSIDHACLSKEEKARAHEIFKRDWEAWCEWIVEKYDDHVKDLPS